MKKVLFLLPLFACLACTEDPSVDPTLMPAATTEGQNTFGCLIDGWVYTSGRFGLPQADSYINEGCYYIDINVPVGQFSAIHLTLVNPLENTTCTYTNAQIDQDNLPDGKAHISRNDGSIISGTFEGGNLSEGRFDIKYADESEGGAVVALK